MTDREAIKGRIVDVMTATEPKVQVQLAEAVRLIAESDFPQKWLNLVPVRILGN